MKLFERLSGLFRWDNTATSPSIGVLLRDKLDAAQQAQYAEQYDEALSLLDEAAPLLDNHPDAITLSIDLELNRADIYIAQAAYDKAGSILDNLIEQSSERKHRTPLSYALSSKGVLLQAQGQSAEARASLEEAADIARDAGAEGAEGRATGHLAEIYLEDGNASYAIHLFREALPLLQGSGDTLLIPQFSGRLGEALYRTGQDQEGKLLMIRALESAVTMRHRPFTRDLNTRLGHIAFQQADYTGAKPYLQNALQLYEPPLPAKNHILTLLVELCLTCLHTDSTTSALEHIQQALDMLTESHPPSLQAQTFAAAGNVQKHLQATDSAREYFQKAIDCYREQTIDPFYIELLGHMAALQTDNTQAQELFQSAVDAATEAQLPDAVATVNVALGDMYYQQLMPRKAIDSWSESVRYFEAENNYEQMADLHSKLSLAWQWLGQGKRAVKELEQGLMRLNFVETPQIRGDVLLRAARVYTDAGDIETAEDFYSDTIELAREEEQARARAERRAWYGRFLSLTGDTKPALLELQETRELCKTYRLTQMRAIVIDAIAITHASASQYPEALTQHALALETLADAPHPVWEAFFLLHQAQTLLRLRRIDEVPSLLESVLQTGRNYHHAPLVAEALLCQAELLLTSEEIEQVRDTLTEAENLVQHIQQRRLQADALSLRSHFHAQTGDPAAATQAWVEASRLYKMMRLTVPHPAWLQSEQS